MAPGNTSRTSSQYADAIGDMTSSAAGYAIAARPELIELRSTRSVGSTRNSRVSANALTTPSATTLDTPSATTLDTPLDTPSATPSATPLDAAFASPTSSATLRVVEAAPSRPHRVDPTVSRFRRRGIDSNTVRILLLVTLSFLLLNSPLALLEAVFYTRAVMGVSSREGGVSSREGPPPDHAQAVYSLVFGVCHLLANVNNACNFALYCLSGKKFRGELRNLFRLRNKSI